jgi:anti-sigma factor RsiW
MKKTVSPRDLEMLSEYLDGRLEARKRVQLEARLKLNPELADTLRDLSQARSLLRSLPKLKAPRSFKLTPEMAGRRATPRIYPAFQFASAIASLLLVLVLAGDFLGLGTSHIAPTAAPLAAPGMAVEVNPEAPTAEAFEAQPATSLQSQAATIAPQQDLAASSSSSGAGTEAPSEKIARSAAANIQLTPTPSPGKNAGISPTLAAPQAATESTQATQPAVALQPAPQSQEAPATQTFQAVGPEETPGRSFPLPVLRIGEIILAVVALGSGLAAYVMRRRLGG